MFDYATAKELAQHAANAEAKHLDPHESYVIVDDLTHEYPWGWVFEPAMEPYRSTGQICPRAGAWCLSVDRFSGKVQVASWAGYRADQWPIVELAVTNMGNDSTAVYQFLRQFKGWTASETRERMAVLPLIIAAGSNTSISALAAALKERGATVRLRQQHAEPAAAPDRDGD